MMNKGGTSNLPPQLHTLNAVRVIAEYFVVRHHCLPDHHYAHEKSANMLGPIGEDLISFFFVLSGFVSVYSSRQVDFTTTSAKLDWGFRKIKRLYPIFLLNYMCCLPVQLFVWMPDNDYCWAGYVCSVLQFFFLDAWAGCGFHFPVLGLAWFISCTVWLWLAFPFFHNFLMERVFSGGWIWIKMISINVIWAFACFMLWDFDLYTVAPFPLLRVGEFLIGCGTACTLHDETPWILANGRYLLFPCLVVAIYVFQTTRHSLAFLCMHETSQHEECNLWHAGQVWRAAEPPCITVLEKVVNKYAMVWAGTIHALARAELAGERDGFLTRILHAELFKTLNSFALTLYLSHISVGYAYRWLASELLGFPKDEWRDDMLLLLIYATCYGVQCCLVRVLGRLYVPNTLPLLEKDSDIEPLVVEVPDQCEYLN
jgi:hypothetical protein